jgi:spermidine synthase
VIGWTERGLIPSSTELKADPRLTISQGDVYARMLADGGPRYDLILIDVDHSPEHPLAAANVSFYDEEGLRRARAHLVPGGVLGVWSYAAHSPFEVALRRVFADVTVEPVTVMNDLIGEEQTDWLFFAR